LNRSSPETDTDDRTICISAFRRAGFISNTAKTANNLNKIHQTRQK